MSQPKFLIVDDDKDARDLITTIIASFGCEAVAVESGAQAIEYLDTLNNAMGIDAIFLDIMMPDMNGYQVIQSLKERMYTASIPVLMLTAKDGKDDIISGYQYGADYYITKPFVRSQIMYGLDLVLGNEGSEAETSDDESASK